MLKKGYRRRGKGLFLAERRGDWHDSTPKRNLSCHYRFIPHLLERGDVSKELPHIIAMMGNREGKNGKPGKKISGSIRGMKISAIGGNQGGRKKL